MIPRPPVVAGTARGSGATTLAVALRGCDAGSLDAPSTGRADLLVCRGDDAGLRGAAAVAVAAPVRPVLAVVTAGPVPRDRLRALAGRFGAVVEVPRLVRWEGAPTPVDEAAAALAQPAEELPGELRELAAGLRALVHALLSTGVLAQGAPPVVTRAVEPVRGPRTAPVSRGSAVTAPGAGARLRQAAGSPAARVVPAAGAPRAAATPDAITPARAAPATATPVLATPTTATPALPASAMATPASAPATPADSATATPAQAAPAAAVPAAITAAAAVPAAAITPPTATPSGTAPPADLDDDAIEALVLAAVG